MANFLNVCKITRKHITEVDAKISQAIVAWEKLENGHKDFAAFFPEKAKKIKDDVVALKRELEVIESQLENNSDKRPFYDEVYNKCVDFLHEIE